MASDEEWTWMSMYGIGWKEVVIIVAVIAWFAGVDIATVANQHQPQQIQSAEDD